MRFIEIGNYVQITAGVTILAHDYSYSVCVLAYDKLPRKQKVTKIGNNVFIGMHSIILMGANIGDNVIIGAGSVVSGVCLPNSVYAGNPAKRLCSLEEYCKKGEEQFIESAKVWAQSYYECKGCYPSVDDMGPYKTLFIEKTPENIAMNFNESDSYLKHAEAKNAKLKISKQFASVSDMFADGDGQNKKW